MADQQTLKHYETNAREYVEAYRDAEVSRQQALILEHFHAHGRTLDVGCASGRDLRWLTERGFQAEGLDAVSGFVERCRAQHPSLKIYHDVLPALPESLGAQATHDLEGRYDNLLISATLMHLPREELEGALRQLRRLVRDGGRALISVRPARAEGADTRREGDRLFTPLSEDELTEALSGVGWRVRMSEQRAEDEQGKRWLTVIVER